MNDTNRRRYGFLPSRTHRLSANDFVGIIVILLFMGLVIHTLAPASILPPDMPSEAQNYAVKPACTKNDVICLIHEYSAKYGIETDIALRIAECESQYGKYEYNIAGSTAKGVYQFIDSTWEYTGGGNVLDPIQNIERFMQFYQDNKHWWVCQ